MDCNTKCNWCTRITNRRIGTGNGGLGNKRMSGDNPNYCISKMSQNAKKSPGDLRRLVVTQTPMEDHQQTLM